MNTFRVAFMMYVPLASSHQGNSADNNHLLRERLIPNKMTGSVDSAYAQGLTDVCD